MARFYKWTIEIKVHETWVADGFDLDDERAHEMLAQHLSHAYGYELKAKVLTAPHAVEIRAEQGEKDAMSIVKFARKVRREISVNLADSILALGDAGCSLAEIKGLIREARDA